jgi:hypothetical protein
MSSEISRANFTISAEAKRAIEDVRAKHDASFPGDPAAVACVAWGVSVPDSGASFDGVMIGFYTQSMLADVAHGIQEVSGMKLVFFITDEHYGKFDGKILDHTVARGFFLV